MQKSVTLHVGGGQAYRGHNARRYKHGSPSHIDEARRGDNETLVDRSPREAYGELFGGAVAEYNARQTRPERRIKDYYAQVKQDKTRHAVYEVIVQVGDMETTGVEGCDTERAILREYIEGFEARNPQMKVVGAYIHADEATLHAHLDFIPWADGYKRGPAVQCSMSKACEQMGYEKGPKINETSQAAWTAAERSALEAITEAHGIEVAHVNDGRQHEADKAVFIAEQKAKKAQEQVNAAQAKMPGLVLEVYQMEQRAKGKGLTLIPTKEVEDLKAVAAEGRETIEMFNQALEGDPSLADHLKEAWAAYDAQQQEKQRTASQDDEIEL